MSSADTSERPAIYEVAGGAPAFLALAQAHHDLCLADPVLEHPFTHGTRDDHVERLAAYLGEVFGGPDAGLYASGGTHSPMLHQHAEMGADDDLGQRFLACFIQAMDDAGLPEDRALREAMRAYMEWAVNEVMAISPHGSVVEEELPMPRWSWDGLQSNTPH